MTIHPSLARKFIAESSASDYNISGLNDRTEPHHAMNDSLQEQALTTLAFEVSNEALPTDPGANPFRLVVDPVMRLKLRRALFDLIESHDQELAKYVAEGSLALDSYKEYIELFAHSLKQTMGTREGVAYMLQACGFEINKDEINLTPETRWKVRR